MNRDLPDKVVHGGLVRQFCQEKGEKVIDFSANLNPWPPAVSLDISSEMVSCYPDDRYQLLKETIAGRFHRPVEEIAVGNGSIELIRVFCLATLSPGDRVRIRQPTFGEYEMSARLAGALPARDGEQPSAGFLCNPNNPTGTLQTRSAVLDELSDVNLLFVDEAFIELSDICQSIVDIRDPAVFTCRSLTKCFSVPGIRFGYAFGDPDLVEQIETIRPPWSVNSIAEQFAIRAFGVFDELERSRSRINAEREWLVSALHEFPVKVHPSSTNFLLLTLPYDATALCAGLARSGILVRDCHSFGLPDSIRIAVRTREENRQLLEAMGTCMR
ncbi:MAG: histidinol-phosphate aminotransferase family protein [Methanoregulaceae archaeon]|nr:histidinol-phosphate aminotransferase family protein [Methanoregulaceae archaeon]MCU0629112.1 histidinol-phosphate aminotransferase family protein [Methanoregulaceae archaeon]